MKNLNHIFVVIVFFFSIKLEAQCPEGSVVFVYQSDINNFAQNYPNCTEINGIINIGSDTLSNITSLSPLNNITSAHGLNLKNNPNLTSLSGLENLTNLTGQLAIQNGNGALITLSGLQNLQSVGGIFIYNAESLTDISALGNITSLDSWLSISFSNSLTNLTGLHNIQYVGSDVLIWYNESITSLSALNNITAVDGVLSIAVNNSTTSLGLSSLTSVTGDVNISSNPLVTSFAELNNLTDIGGSIKINSNSSLASIEGLSNLTSLGGYIDISSNNALTSLAGLENITSIGGYINLEQNEMLTDISALQNINPETIFGDEWTSGITIIDNPLLSICNLPNICAYLAQDSETHTREISGNLEDCLTEEAVIAACALDVDKIELTNTKLFPNPVNSTLFFEKEISKVTLTDLTGKTLITLFNVNQVDMTSFESGIYLITIEQENQKLEIRKIVKN